MHIYIVAQYLNVAGNGEDRLLELSRQWLARGNIITVFTINSGSSLELGKKKIGLFKEGGITTVTFNAPYSPQMGAKDKLNSYRRFARMVKKQGLALPKPDLIISVTPPLSAAIAALWLSKKTGARLITEVRELWPAALKERGTLRNWPLYKYLSTLEEKQYLRSDHLVAINEEIAGAIKERGVKQDKISVVPLKAEAQEQFLAYNRLAASLKSFAK